MFLEVFSEWFVEGDFHELEWKILLAVGFKK